jgi:PAS domain S-box-containing protein
MPPHIRKRTPHDAWPNDRRLQAILDNTTAVIYVKDLEGRYLLVNRQFEVLFHLTRDEIQGRTDHDIFPADFADAFCANDRRVLAAGESTEFEEVVPQDDGVHTYISIKFPLHDAAGMVEAVCGISTDITERQRAEERLRHLAQRLVTVREEERQRLGFDLHDGVCQELIGIAILVDAARARLGPTAAASAPELAQISVYLTHMSEHLRELARDLRPMLLHDLGLARSLAALAAGLSTSGLAITADLPSDLPRLADEIETSLYRIAQEALSNAIRHARARHIELRLAVVDDRIDLIVRDDGCGFEPHAYPVQGLGIASMEQRALALHGELQVSSVFDRGTTVHFTCPLRRVLPATS